MGIKANVMQRCMGRSIMDVKAKIMQLRQRFIMACKAYVTQLYKMSMAIGCMVLPFHVGAFHMDAEQMELSTLVKAVARSEGYQVIGLETLSGKVSLALDGKTGLDALEQLAKHEGFQLSHKENTIIVDGNQSNRHVHEFGPKYSRLEDVKPAIALIVGDDHVKVLPHTNQLIYASTYAEDKEINKLLADLDQSPPQVHLEVAVVAMEHNYAKEVGINWSWQGIYQSSDSESSSGLSSESIHIGPKGDNHYNWLFHPDVHAKENDGKLALIARPSVVTVSGEEAKILIGERIPVLVETTSNGMSRTSIRYEEAGIRLHATPYVTNDHIIDTMITAEVSNPSLVSELKAYRITTREAKTRVRLKDGETLIIGGLMDSREMKQMQKIPLLGNLPILGKLFSHSRRTKDEVELYILITTKLLPSERFPSERLPDDRSH